MVFSSLFMISSFIHSSIHSFIHSFIDHSSESTIIPMRVTGLFPCLAGLLARPSSDPPMNAALTD